MTRAPLHSTISRSVAPFSGVISSNGWCHGFDVEGITEYCLTGKFVNPMTRDEFGIVDLWRLSRMASEIDELKGKPNLIARKYHHHWKQYDRDIKRHNEETESLTYMLLNWLRPLGSNASEDDNFTSYTPYEVLQFCQRLIILLGRVIRHDNEFAKTMFEKMDQIFVNFLTRHVGKLPFEFNQEGFHVVTNMVAKVKSDWQNFDRPVAGHAPQPPNRSDLLMPAKIEPRRLRCWISREARRRPLTIEQLLTSALHGGANRRNISVGINPINAMGWDAISTITMDPWQVASRIRCE